MNLFYIILIPAASVGCLLCVGGWYVFYLYIFVLDRRKEPKKITPIIYLPEIIPEEIPPPPADFKIKKNKRERRRLRLLRFLERKNFRPNLESPTSVQTAEDEKPEGFFSTLVNFFSSKDKDDNCKDIEEGNDKKADDLALVADELKASVKRNDIGKRRVWEKPDEESKEELISDEVMSFYVPYGASLFEIDRKDIRESVIERRKEERAQKKLESAAKGDIDVVKLNSGPPIELIPPEYSIFQGTPELTPQFLSHRRVFYLFDDPEDRHRQGWFIGTIGGASKRPEFNFNIKFDKFETKNIYVDGIENVNLKFSGIEAYGRRWVLLVPRLQENG